MSLGTERRELRSLENTLKEELGGKRSLIMGIGNPERGDDAIGTKTAKSLKCELNNISVLDCRTNPENYLLEARSLEPEKVIYINAVRNGAPSGKLFFKELDLNQDNQFSTHKIALGSISNILSGLLSGKIGKKDFHLLGIEIADTFQMTKKVEKRVRDLTNVFSYVDQVAKPINKKGF
ncbi:MAG: NiFe-hydrogenase maturation factor [Candidatus Methanohalarchaeum thermophilum]|uniref:NiFe-hydrogenase maturation factor n=1 Tax=Methanohalarchaeum thermophilum TaxID=1903181 RepID=A0A1Q6DUH4_METT1|nr:MAG: NiFe-hydrogenase maturation factor [Candidatus Methanohalarchaeum thermophilum]